MTTAVVALAAVVVVLIMMLVFTLWQQSDERSQWSVERRMLLDRVIAQHTGDVIALDRSARPTTRLDSPDRPQAVGLG